MSEVVLVTIEAIMGATCGTISPTTSLMGTVEAISAFVYDCEVLFQRYLLEIINYTTRLHLSLQNSRSY